MHLNAHIKSIFRKFIFDNIPVSMAEIKRLETVCAGVLWDTLRPDSQLKMMLFPLSNLSIRETIPNRTISYPETYALSAKGFCPLS